jgi:hypothetical protein
VANTPWSAACAIKWRGLNAIAVVAVFTSYASLWRGILELSAAADGWDVLNTAAVYTGVNSLTHW